MPLHAPRRLALWARPCAALPAHAPLAALAAHAPLAALAALSALAACSSAARQAPARLPAPITIDLPSSAPVVGAVLALTTPDDTGRAPVRWIATPYERAWVAPDGVLTLLEPGVVTVVATDGRRVGSRQFVVQPNPAARVVMEQRVVTTAMVGDTLRVRGHVYDGEGVRVPEAPVAYGIVLRGAPEADASVTADGRFVAAEPGVYTVLAQSGRVSGRTIVIVESDEDRFARALAAERAAGVPPRHQDTADSADVRHPASAGRGDSTAAIHGLARVTVAAARTSRVVIDDTDAAPYDGTTFALDARVWTSGEDRPDSTAQVVWTSSDPERAYVSQRGQVVFLAPGWVTVTATHGGIAAARRFNVRWHPGARLALQANTTAAHVGQPVRFREEVWQPGGTPVADARVNYALLAHGAPGPVRATISEGRVFTATRPGVYTVIAEVGGVADKYTLYVSEVPPPPAKGKPAPRRPAAARSR
jgi:hypothetical protein